MNIEYSSCGDIEASIPVKRSVDREEIHESPSTASIQPAVFSQQAKPTCGLSSSSFGSYWRLVSSAKDKVNPLRLQKQISKPERRSFGYQQMEITVDELKVRLE